MSGCLQDLDLQPLLSGLFTGDAAAIYPKFKKVGDPYMAPVWMALVGLELSSSLTIFGGIGALMVVIGKQDNYLTFSKSLPVPIVHLTDVNSISGPPPISIPTSKVTPMSFGAFGRGIPPNTKIQLYASGDTTAGNRIFGACSLQLVEVKAPSAR